jgi:uncharacterized Zn finger protein
MATRDCPNCETPTPRRLEDVGRDVVVSSYRCEECGHVWSLSTLRDPDDHQGDHADTPVHLH